MASDGAPYGVSTTTSRMSARPSILYRPLPPMIPKRKVSMSLQESGRPQRRLGHQRHLLPQFQYAVLPVALGVKPREGGRESRVVPASRQPARIMDQAQGAQRLDQVQFVRVEFAKVFIAR